MPNFEPFNSKLRELEGVKIFHKTGSGTKSRPKFKNRFHPKCAEKWAATCCKVSGQSNARKMLGETFKFSRDPQGGATRRKAEDGKLLCISELTSNGVDGARTLKLLYTWRIRSRSEPGQIGERARSESALGRNRANNRALQKRLTKSHIGKLGRHLDVWTTLDIFGDT